MSAPNGHADPAQVAANVEAGRHSALLGAILTALRSESLETAVADFQHRQMVLEGFPVTGSKRVLVYRTGSGNDNLPVPTTGVLVVQSNSGRFGGTIVNSGASTVILYLCSAGVATPGAPAIYLAANGGSWDFRLGNMLWCGSVSAVAQGASSSLTVAEV